MVISGGNIIIVARQKKLSAHLIPIYGEQQTAISISRCLNLQVSTWNVALIVH